MGDPGVTEDNGLVADTRAAIAPQWSVPPVAVRPEDDTWQALREELAARILELLRNRPQKLLTALYVLDLGERAYAGAMDQPTMEDRAWHLAQAVLERESRRVATRRRYGGGAAEAPPPDALPPGGA